MILDRTSLDVLATNRKRAREAADPAQRVRDRIASLIAEIDRRIHAQVEAVLHHPRFQRLEASWRGLEYLTGQLEEGDNILVRVMSARWSDLRRDFQEAADFDDNTLYRLLYDGELAMPGGRPFGVLLGDYEVCHRLTGHGETNEGDLATLEHIANIAAASFMPFVTAAHPSLLNLKSHRELERPFNLAEEFKGVQYTAWRSFRKRSESRFVVALLPRVLMRAPYADEGISSPSPSFPETTESPDAGRHLWGSPVYAYGGVLMRSFRTSGLFFDISGVRLADPVPAGGLVADLPAVHSRLDAADAWPLPPLEVALADRAERDLVAVGIAPLCSVQYTSTAAFYTDPSLHEPALYQDAAATANAQLGAHARYIFSVSRLAHCLYVMARNMIGDVTDESRIQEHLNNWLVSYTSVIDRPDAGTRARYPFREASVDVSETVHIGRYECTIRLKPHPELHGIHGVIELSTQFRGTQA